MNKNMHPFPCLPTISAAILSALFAAVSTAVFADDAATRGAKPGQWTQDYDAAVALSREQNLPLFLKFTGSDWCGWCMLMEEQVFGEKEFKNWAKSNIVLVSLDFPKGKNVKTVPDSYKERNRQLANEYGVQGFPTYFVLSPTGASLGQMGAKRDYTAKAFLDDLSKILEQGGADLVAERLSEEERAELERLKAAPAEREKAKAALAKERKDATASSRRKMAAAADAAEAAQKAAHNEVLADFRALDQRLKAKEADLTRRQLAKDELEKAKAAIAKERADAIAEGQRKIEAAKEAAKTALDAKREKIAAELRTREEEIRAKEAALEAQAESDAARQSALEAKLR